MNTWKAIQKLSLFVENHVYLGLLNYFLTASTPSRGPSTVIVVVVVVLLQTYPKLVVIQYFKCKILQNITSCSQPRLIPIKYRSILVRYWCNTGIIPVKYRFKSDNHGILPGNTFWSWNTFCSLEHILFPRTHFVPWNTFCSPEHFLLLKHFPYLFYFFYLF